MKQNKKKPLSVRFNKFIEKKESCWMWKGHINKDGYGTFLLNGKKTGAHRVSWIIHKGIIPLGLYVCHSCDVRSCVNFDHLFLGTHTDNMQDMVKKGRNKNLKLSSEQVKKIKEILKEKNKSHSQIACIFNISKSSISAISNGQNWSNV